MLVLWLCMGLWHGNSWKYIIGEDLWFWLVIVVGQISEPLSKRAIAALHIWTVHAVWHGFQTIRTLLLYLLGMLFFRAESLMDAFRRIAAGCHVRLNVRFISELIGFVDFTELGGVEGLLLMTVAIIIVICTSLSLASQESIYAQF